MAITLPANYLESHLAGIKLQVSGKGGSYELAVPAAYIQGFMAAMPLAQ